MHADYPRASPSSLGEERADGILLDLGVSSVQLDTPSGASASRPTARSTCAWTAATGETAAEVVNRMREDDLADVIYRFGEERASRRIARAIVDARRGAAIATTDASWPTIVRRAAAGARRPGLDPATRTFQALRIYVNRELEGLGAALRATRRAASPRAAAWP